MSFSISGHQMRGIYGQTLSRLLRLADLFMCWLRVEAFKNAQLKCTPREQRTQCQRTHIAMLIAGNALPGRNRSERIECSRSRRSSENMLIRTQC